MSHPKNENPRTRRRTKYSSGHHIPNGMTVQRQA